MRNERETGYRAESRLHKGQEIVVFPPQIEVINTFRNPENMLHGLAQIAVGEGYVPYSHDYLALLLEMDRQMIVASGKYTELVADTADKMLKDPYGQSGRAGTINGIIQLDAAAGKDLGVTARLVLGKETPEDGLQPLEVMDLATPKGTDWKTFLKRRKIDLDKTCEIGRAVVPKGYRDMGLTTPLVRQLFQNPGGIIETAQDLGMEHAVMIAQKRFAKHAKKALPFRGPFPITLTETGEEMAREFPGYWNDLQDPPGLYVVKLPQRIAA